MKVEPIITEKSLFDAEHGKYTFRISKKATKYTIKKLISELFGVHVVTVRTMNQKEETRGGTRRRKSVIPAFKKAIVTLKKDEKIDLFEVKQNS